MKDDMRPIKEFNTSNKGVFVVCEGNFMYGNASLSYYDKQYKTVENTVFLKANGIPLGDVAQSLTIYDSTAYIVVNNSGKIYMIDVNNFVYKGKITGLVSPRYMQFISPSKAYVTDMYSKCIYTVNPQTSSIINTIDIATESEQYYRHSSEEIVFCDKYMFTNSWSYNDKILVIDTETDKLIDTITVFKQPRKIILDKNKKLWVLCDGGYDNSPYQDKSGIVKINTGNFQIEKMFELNNSSISSDMKINFNGDTIYYIDRHIYRFHVNDNELPTTEYINSGNKNLYALGIDPYNSDLYVSDAIDFMQSGVIYRYNANKECVDTFEVGIIPNSFVFK
ncbi:MAG: YncE family protein [Bacteroidales bacterium]|jgi:YVTN family beta-propeller protein|nr:YncE family protein [Bacteroidales bacterium]